MTDLRRLALIASILLALVASAGDVYRWVDADGRVHFADSPPPGIPAEKLGIVSLPTDPAAVDLAETTRQVRENQAEADAIVASNAAKEAAAKAEQKAEQCAAAKSRYAAVQNSRKFSTVGADGKETWVSGGEAAALKAKLQADIAAKCDGS